MGCSCILELGVTTAEKAPHGNIPTLADTLMAQSELWSSTLFFSPSSLMVQGRGTSVISSSDDNFLQQHLEESPTTIQLKTF